MRAIGSTEIIAPTLSLLRLESRRRKSDKSKQYRDTTECWLHWLPFGKSVLAARGLRARTHLVPKNKRTFHAGNRNIGGAVAVQISHDELRTHAGAVVNQFGNEFGAPF